MSRFAVTALPLAGLQLVTRTPLRDARGFLVRLYCADELAAAGFTPPVAQLNHTGTARRGSVRGLHYQSPPHSETKLVSCIRGEIWDVAVDLRAGSPTFLHWHAELLSAANQRALLIPQGFAHGFQSLCDDVELLYCHSTAYVASAEAGLHVQDPKLAIAWPLPVAGLSPRDAGFAAVTEAFRGIDANIIEPHPATTQGPS